MQIDDYYRYALDRVLSLDLPDEALPYAVSAEASHLAGLDSDWEVAPD